MRKDLAVHSIVAVAAEEMGSAKSGRTSKDRRGRFLGSRLSPQLTERWNIPVIGAIAAMMVTGFQRQSSVVGKGTDSGSRGQLNHIRSIAKVCDGAGSLRGSQKPCGAPRRARVAQALARDRRATTRAVPLDCSPCTSRPQRAPRPKNLPRVRKFEQLSTTTKPVPTMARAPGRTTASTLCVRSAAGRGRRLLFVPTRMESTSIPT